MLLLNKLKHKIKNKTNNKINHQNNKNKGIKTMLLNHLKM